MGFLVGAGAAQQAALQAGALVKQAQVGVLATENRPDEHNKPVDWMQVPTQEAMHIEAYMHKKRLKIL